VRYTVAWADVISENLTLKAAILSLSAISCALLFLSVKLALREPIVIDRGCVTRAIETTSGERSSTEIEAFVREAIHQRFDSDATAIPGYLSEQEDRFRAQEQEELSKSGARQKVIINSVKKEGDKVTMDSDRVISMAQVRSAFPFPLSVMLKTTARSSANPYGLVIENVAALTQEGSKK
jgi:hypothetical protein